MKTNEEHVTQIYPSKMLLIQKNRMTNGKNNEELEFKFEVVK